MTNTITKVTTNDLVVMSDSKEEALILRGCGGDVNEWVDGINEMFTEENLLLEGTKFTEVYVFEYDGLTCIAFPFKGVKLNICELAMWRIATRDTFGGMWMSDFVDNYLRPEYEDDRED